jgi:hypothetical protein
MPSIDEGKSRMTAAIAVLVLVLPTQDDAKKADVPPSKEQIAGLRPFAKFVGNWKGAGTGETTRDWKEKLDCTWGFRKRDGRASLNFVSDGGKLFTEGVLSFDPAEKKYRFSARNKKDEVLRFEGKPVGDVGLRLDRVDEGATDHLDRLELKAPRGGDKLLFDFRKKRGTSSYDQFAIIEFFRTGGEEASAEKFTKGPFCVVTGGPGRIEFTHNGKTLHAADEACKEEFLAHPERYPDAGKQ